MSVRFHIELADDAAEMLFEEARRRGLTAAELLRHWIRSSKEVDTEGSTPEQHAHDPIWSIVGAIDSGTTDGSENHDVYLYGEGD